MKVYPHAIICVTEDVRVAHHAGYAHEWHFGFWARWYYGPFA